MGFTSFNPSYEPPDAVELHRDPAGGLDHLVALLGAGEIADHREHRLLVGRGIVDAGTPAGHRVTDDQIAVAAVKAFDHGGEHGLVERKAHQQAADVAYVGHVFSKPRR